MTPHHHKTAAALELALAIAVVTFLAALITYHVEFRPAGAVTVMKIAGGKVLAIGFALILDGAFERRRRARSDAELAVVDDEKNRKFWRHVGFVECLKREAVNRHVAGWPIEGADLLEMMWANGLLTQREIDRLTVQARFDADNGDHVPETGRVIVFPNPAH